MSEAVSSDGLYAVVHGGVYSANRDTQGRLVLTTSNPHAKTQGFVDRHGVGTYTKVVEPAELDELFRVRHEGTYSGTPVSMSVSPRGEILVGTPDARVAEALSLPRVDKAWWELRVAPDDPALSIREVREQVPIGSQPDSPRQVDRYFASFDADRIPLGLLRRHYTPGGHEDEVLRDTGTWKPDVHGSVSRALVNALESPLEEIAADQASEIEEMVAARSYHPFRS